MFEEDSLSLMLFPQYSGLRVIKLDDPKLSSRSQYQPSPVLVFYPYL